MNEVTLLLYWKTSLQPYLNMELQAILKIKISEIANSTSWI